MAVQKDKPSRSRRGMRRAHDALHASTLSIDETTGEVHRRHHLTDTGHYRGRERVVIRNTTDNDNDDNE